MSGGSDELDELLEDTDVSNRIEEAAKQSDSGDADEDGPQTLEDRIYEERAAIEAGEAHKNITAHDGEMAALIRVIESDDALADEVLAALAETAGVDAPDLDAIQASTRAAVMRLALRAGFRSALPEVYEATERADYRVLKNQP